MVKLHGPSESYDLAPRANIFRRDQGNAHNFSAFKRLMRSNNYKTDPLSHGHACETICCRDDLEVDYAQGRPTAEKPSGCYDAKATSATLMASLTVEAESGPTHESLPPFRWDEP